MRGVAYFMSRCQEPLSLTKALFYLKLQNFLEVFPISRIKIFEEIIELNGL